MLLRDFDLVRAVARARPLTPTPSDPRRAISRNASAGVRAVRAPADENRAATCALEMPRAPAPRPSRQSPLAISVIAHRRGSSATPTSNSTARLMPSRLGSEIDHASGHVLLLEQPQHALAGGRRIVVRDDRLARQLLHRHLPAGGKRVPGGTSSTSSSLPTGPRAAPTPTGWNVSAPKSRLPCCTSTAIWRAGTRRTSMAMSGYRRRNRGDERQQRVHGRLVGADEHAPAPQIAQLAHRRLGFLGQPDQPLGVVAAAPARHRSACRSSTTDRTAARPGPLRAGGRPG